MSVFSFLDEVTEVKKDEAVTVFFTLKGDEEFLKDHFEAFPVMPGVLQLEALKQAAVTLLVESRGGSKQAYHLTEAADVRFGQFVRPGSRLRIQVRLTGTQGSRAQCSGRIDLMRDGQAAGRCLSADLTLEKKAG